MSTNDIELDGVSAELTAIVRTADLIAHDGLQPDSDGPRVLAGLISQLGNQVLRVVQPDAADPRRSAGEQSSEDKDVVSEEDISPQDAPAEPRREI